MERLKDILASRVAFVVILGMSAYFAVIAFGREPRGELAINPVFVAIAVGLFATAFVTRRRRQ